MKRAYRGKPNVGYCTSPVMEWTQFSQFRMQILEELPRFSHVSCQGMINTLSLPDQSEIQGTIDINSAGAFHQTLANNQEISDTMLRDSLLSATRKFVTELGMDDDEVAVHPSPECTGGRADWISWAVKEADAQVKAAVAVTRGFAPVVIGYGEVAGEAKNEQVDFSSDVQKIKCQTPVVLP